jgi:acyl-CoA thioesterase YciA
MNRCGQSGRAERQHQNKRKKRYVGDEVSLYAGILRVGKTSMPVRIEAWRRSRTAEDKYKVTEATFKFVAVDEDRKPRLVPSARTPD